MINFFTTKVKYTKQLENGTFKRVTDLNLVQAQSFTDAEAMIYEQLGKIIKGEFNVLDISKTELHDIFFSDANEDLFWFKIKIVFGSIDPDTEKNKKVTNTFYVQGTSIQNAQSNLTEKLTNLIQDYEITSTNLTKIQDIYFAPEVSVELENKEYVSLIDMYKLSNLQVVSIVSSWYTGINNSEIRTPDIFQSKNGLDLEENFAMYDLDYNVIDELKFNEREVLTVVRDWYHNFYKSAIIDNNHTEFFDENGNDLGSVLRIYDETQI